MGKSQVFQKAMALPLADRQELAAALWDSIEHDMPTDDADTREALALAVRRAEELDSDPSLAITHEEVMAAARKALR